jgi:oligopeptide transport system permease protein
MIRYIFRRLLESFLVIVIVYACTYWMLMAVPGDPFISGDKKPPEAVVEALREKYGLANPMTGFVCYPQQLILHGDLGPSVQYEDFSVGDIIKASLPVSVSLGSLALVIALWGGVILGTLGAMFKGRWPDMALTVLTLAGVSRPTFVVGTMLLLAFGVYLAVLPSGGWGRLSQLILPAGALAVFYMAYIARLTRSGVLDVLNADYVRTARAKGLPPHKVIGSHVLRNAGLPILSYLGPAAATVLTGSFVVEKVFAIPGLGTHFINACINVDIPLVLGSVLTYTVMVVLFNLLVDIAYSFLDPRVTLS